MAHGPWAENMTGRVNKARPLSLNIISLYIQCLVVFMLFRLNLKFARLDYQGMNNEPILSPGESEQTHLA